MGALPCSIIPAPKKLDLRPSGRPWPARFDVACEATASRPLQRRFAEELRGHGSGSLAMTLAAGSPAAAGYTIELRSDVIQVASGDARGFYHAFQTLKQLMADPIMPLGRIEDAPSLDVRGFHLNFESYRRMGLEEALRLVEAAARFKLNTLLVEYGPRFPFEKHPHLRAPNALTPADIERLCGVADDLGIQIIPLQQSLAHVDYILAHDSRVALREQPDKPGLLCPSHPDAIPLIKDLMTEVIALHPKATWFHLGGDEARKVGRCGRCEPLARQNGVGELYGRHIGELARFLLDKGKRPIVWDDTLCAFHDAIDHLPKETIIDYWDYIAVADPTPVLIPRMAHVDGAPRVVHDWRWKLMQKRGRLSEVQIAVMKNYSHAARLPSALGKKYMDEFGRYLGRRFPKWMRALPYLEYYQDRGHDVITSPTGMGNGDMSDGSPNFARFDANIATHTKRCKENTKALGIITTAWYNMPPELLYQPLIRTAMCAW